MKRFAWLAAVGLAAALPIALATASGDATQPAGRTFRVHQKQTSFNVFNVSNGVVITTTHDLLIRGSKVGRDAVVCTKTGPGSFFECIGTAFFPRGRVEQQGGIDPIGTDRFTLAITGGTGKYSGAGGTVEVNRMGNDAINVYRLR